MAPTETYVVKSGENYLAWCASMYAWGETEAKAREKLRTRLDHGQAPGDPLPLLDGGFVTEAKERTAAWREEESGQGE